MIRDTFLGRLHWSKVVRPQLHPQKKATDDYLHQPKIIPDVRSRMFSEPLADAQARNGDIGLLIGRPRSVAK
jgi:hypothetical protein